jgi:four helix bundle protein
MPYHRLEVFKKSYAVALEIHKITKRFPKHEQYEIGQQLRRSSKSIPVNIAEGMGKQESKKDVIHYVRTAMGSCDETRVWLEFCQDLGYLSESDRLNLDEQYQQIGRMLHGVRKRYEAR